jgi:alkaline phosphatase D
MLVLLIAASVTHGVAVGEVTATSAVIWSRANEPAEMIVELEANDGSASPRSATALATPERDFTAKVRIDGLEPGTTYRYRVRFDDSESVSGSFRTAPRADVAEPVRFVVMGDLGGHGYCRERGKGYSVFSEMERLEPDFLVANGDMIYADSACPAERAEGGHNIAGDFPRIDDPSIDWTNATLVREVYLAHWRYNRADPHFQRLLATTSMYSQWDDHEVINDFGAAWPTLTASLERSGYPTLVREGRDALFDFHPMMRHPDEPDRIYRSFRWGKDAELFLLDARSYRSLNDLSDRPDNDKTMLGREQLDWLEDAMSRSDATWKIVSTDVPLSIPTGSQANLYGRDGFADGTSSDYSARTGFERELNELLEHLDRENVTNVVFVATDVHFAASLRYDVDVDDDGDRLLFHELISGPLSAIKLTPPEPDPTFGPRVLYSEGDLFNFSFVTIERRESVAHLIADVRDDSGAVRNGSSLTLIAQ